MGVNADKLNADQEKFKAAAALIENTFSFLVRDYRFKFEKKMVVYGTYIYYTRDEFQLLMTYGAPEFVFEMSINFPFSDMNHDFGVILMTKLFLWNPNWTLGRDRKDHLRFEMKMAELFLRHNIKMLLADSVETEEILKKQEEVLMVHDRIRENMRQKLILQQQKLEIRKEKRKPLLEKQKSLSKELNARQAELDALTQKFAKRQ